MFVAKYSASGNDFVIFHTLVKKERSNLAQKLCNRHDGVGADGLVVVLPHSEYDFQWQFYNSDGSIASMCGNASRAVAHYAFIEGLAQSEASFLTGAGVIKTSVQDDFVVSDLSKADVIEPLINEDENEWSLIDTGVPHLVRFTKSIEEFDLIQARKLRQKYNANVNIWTTKGEKIFVRTYERGVEDETLACGTGMAACFLQGVLSEKISTKVSAIAKSKEQLELEFVDGVIKFGGKVKRVFDAVVSENVL